MQSFAEQCWKVVFTAKPYLYTTEDEGLKISLLALQAIQALEMSTEPDISPDQARHIASFLSEPLSDSEYTKISAHLQFTGNGKLWRTLKGARELFLPTQTDSVKQLKTKMLAITKSLEEPIEAPFKTELKLTPQDLRLLTVAVKKRKLLSIFMEKGISCYFREFLFNAWGELENLCKSDVFDEISNRCERGYKPGLIYFYDWHFVEITDFYPLDLSWTIRHVLRSRIPHVGIIIEDDQRKPQFSHVNGAMGAHGIHPINFPILGAFGNFGELDITSLIPQTVSENHHSQIKKCFSKAFIKFASELHPEVKLEWNLTSILGHKRIATQSLSEVDLSAEESQSCSSYVGVIFLKAVNEVNKQLVELGYQEQIPHPFGEHEIVNRVDTLQLIYHWKQLKVLKVVALDAFVNKVFAAPLL